MNTLSKRITKTLFSALKILTYMLIVFVLTIGILLLRKELLPYKGADFTDNINNYNNSDYYIPKAVFPSQIPTNAEIVAFSCYKYSTTKESAYLELKFNSAEEMNTYISKVVGECEAYMRSRNFPQNTDVCFIEKTNLYNSSYKDMFCTYFISSQYDESYTGYKIYLDEDSSELIYNGFFGTISYSFDELTVIHNYSHGWFSERIFGFIPRYFTRFNATSHGEHENKISLDFMFDP